MANLSHLNLAPIRPFLRWALAIQLIAALSLAAFAQLPTTTITPAPAVPPQGWDNPQDSIQTFIQDMKNSDISDARKGMDLSDVPFPVRDIRGGKYASFLISILSRIPGFRPETIPTTPKTATVSIPVKVGNGRLAGTLVLAKSSSGAWLFDSKTVASLPRLYQEIQFEPQDNEIGQFPEPPTDPAMEIRAYIPEFLLHTFLWMEIWQWIGLGLLLVGSALISLLVRILVRVSLRVFFKHWLAILTTGSAKSLRRSLGLMSGVLLWRAGYPFLGFYDTEATNLVIIVCLKAFGIGAAAWLLDAFFDVLMDSISARASVLVRRADQILIPIAKKFVRFLFLIGALLAFASSMSVNVTALVAGLGVGGLILALAGKDSVENIFGSLTIIFDMPFGIGDYIKLASGEGTVEEINLRSTRIRTSADTLVTVPNSNLITASVENFGARRFRRTKLTLPLSYTNEISRIHTLCDKIRAIIEGNTSVNQEMSHVNLDSASDSYLGVSVQVYFKAETYAEELHLRESLISDIMTAVVDAKVILGPVTWNPINAPEDMVADHPPEPKAPSK